jgi:hypothetical protein
MMSGVEDGWYREWATSQTLDSESPLPNLFRRNDVRHSAQIASALCRWSSGRDPLADLVSNIAGSKLISGFWPESPDDSRPRLLASVYCLEALAYVLAEKFRISAEDLLGRPKASEAWASFRYGLAALHEEADRGGGLLGASFGKPTPYLTGIALYRLAPLALAHSDVASLAVKLIGGLVASQASDGWIDSASLYKRQEETRKRTTLRVIAGLGRAKGSGVEISSVLMDNIVDLAIAIGRESCDELDSPDFACLASVLEDVVAISWKHLDMDSIETNAAALNEQYRDAWRETLEDYIQRLEQGVDLGLPKYEVLSADLRNKASLLKVRKQDKSKPAKVVI